MSDSQTKAGGKPGNSNAVQHGVYALMKFRRKAGKPDGRTAFGRNFKERQAAYTEALGNDLSPMLETLVEDTVWEDFYIATCDQYLSQLRQFIRKGKAHPLVDVRVKLANSRRSNLQLMGFKRVVPVKSISDMDWTDPSNESDTPQDGQAAQQDGQDGANGTEGEQ